MVNVQRTSRLSASLIRPARGVRNELPRDALVAVRNSRVSLAGSSETRKYSREIGRYVEVK